MMHSVQWPHYLSSQLHTTILLPIAHNNSTVAAQDINMSYYTSPVPFSPYYAYPAPAGYDVEETAPCYHAHPHHAHPHHPRRRHPHYRHRQEYEPEPYYVRGGPCACCAPPLTLRNQPAATADLDAEERALAQRLAAIRAQKAQEAAAREEAIRVEIARRQALEDAQRREAQAARQRAIEQVVAARRQEIERERARRQALEQAARIRAIESRPSQCTRGSNRWEQRYVIWTPPLSTSTDILSRIPQVLNGANDAVAALASLGLLPNRQSQRPQRQERNERSTADNVQNILSHFGLQPPAEQSRQRTVPAEVNDVLAKLFGFTIGSGEQVRESRPPRPESAPEPAPTPAPEPVEVEAPAPAPEAPKAEEPKSEDSNPVVSKEVNDLLSALFGFRVEKATEEDVAAAQAAPDETTATTEGKTTATEDTKPAAEDASRPVLPKEINDVLSNLFGFSIEPLSEATGASSSCAEQSCGLESYVKDALNQQALENDIKTTADAKAKAAPTAQRKGKAVAEGERQPKPARSDALEKLSELSSELAQLRSTFTFPERLAFGSSPDESSTAAPPLLYNSTNAPYHLHAHQLLQLLVKADAIESNGDKAVRKARKDVVRRVEEELEALEAEREKLWAQVKRDPRAARVEDSDDEDDSGSGSDTSSVKEVDSKTYAEAVAVIKSGSESTEAHKEEERGYEVPAPAPEEAAEETQAPEPEVAAPAADPTPADAPAPVPDSTQATESAPNPVADRTEESTESGPAPQPTVEEEKKSVGDEFEML